MKFYLPLLLMLLGIPGFAQSNTKLLTYKLFTTVTKEDLQQKMKKNHVPKALVKVRYQVDVYDVEYISAWHDGTPIKASGLYYVPHNAAEALPQVVYHHGTRMEKGRHTHLGGEEMICVGYAAEGYAVLMPDYIGLGTGDKFHLYQNSASEGQASVDMLYAIRQLDDTLGIKKNSMLFLTGYSQGGHATLATHKLLEEKYSKDFKVTASSANSGAYDMDGVQSTVMFIPYEQPHYLPYLLLGINEVYKIVPYDINKIYKSPYDTLIPQMFDGRHDIGAVNRALPAVPKDMVLDSMVEVFKNDPDFPLHKVLQENSLCDWKPEAPVQMCYCDKDEQVYYKNSIVARDKMRANGAKHVVARRAGKKYGHYKCAIFASMYSMMYFDSFRHGSKYGNKGSVNKRFLLAMAKLAIKP